MTTRRWLALLVAALLPLAWLPLAIPEILGSDGFPRWFWFGQIGVMLYGVLLIFVSIRLILRNRALSDGQRAGWLVACILAAPFGLVVYLFVHCRTGAPHAQ